MQFSLWCFFFSVNFVIAFKRERKFILWDLFFSSVDYQFEEEGLNFTIC